jgi:gliding motility-associated-like protein
VRKTLVILFLFISFLSTATHLVGGEFRLYYLGRGSQYQLTLTTYFDEISTIPKDDNIWVGIYRKSNDEQVGDDIQLPLTSSSRFLDYSNDECIEVTSNLVTRVLEYGARVIISADDYNDPEGYYVVWQRCCRNAAITNIGVPDSEGMTFYMEFPGTSVGRNYSPVFEDPPVTYLCTGRPFSFDFSASDFDGDSLVYEMADPWGVNDPDCGFNWWDRPGCHNPGPFESVNWLSGYSKDNAIPGNGALAIDAETGLLSVTPSEIGLFVFAVSVSEYRDGVKIGMVRRDFQVLVSDECADNVAPDLYLTDGDFVEELVDTNIIAGSEDRCVDVLVSDSNDVVTLEVTYTNFDQSLIELVNDGVVPIVGEDTLGSGEVCWDNCADSEDGVFELTLTVEDEGCPFRSRTDKKFVFMVSPVPNDTPRIHLSTDPISEFQVLIDGELSLTLSGAENDGQNIWLNYVGDPDLFEMGASFENKSGTDSLSSVFEWEPTCDHEDFEKDTLLFRIFEESCGELIGSEVEVVLELLSPQLFNADYEPMNVLTPNGDGLNDCFEMTGLRTDVCGDEFSRVVLYNRWGSKVFESNSRDFRWCDIDLTDGVYFYYVEYSGQNPYRGWMTIVR